MPIALPTQGRARSPMWPPGQKRQRREPRKAPFCREPGGPAPWHPSDVACPLELLGLRPHGLLLHGLHGLLHVDDELRGLPALSVDSHRLDALHVVRGHHQVVLLGQLHRGLLEGLLDHDRVVGAGLLVRYLCEGKRKVTQVLLLGPAITTESQPLLMEHLVRSRSLSLLHTTLYVCSHPWFTDGEGEAQCCRETRPRAPVVASGKGQVETQSPSSSLDAKLPPREVWGLPGLPKV